ncbi:hypothetical protein FISHEDRAFT_64862 [Fistulina hepatica ATCC 64428]|uniref:SH3 domain-containing protein n=1 Tax=Fistulina hepatica ATCC 64428 TaxID=1128425 RepID=A0A0D7AGA5_9AGAR|nr:hypothetical protein FISHEDRAFT_64862 [Fistulina hepatica ATCC 64428]
MGQVGLAGAFAGIGLFDNASAALDSSAATLLSRSDNGSLSTIASTNSGGRLSAGCAMNNVFYVGGSFSEIGGTTATNIAAYSSGAFSALGSGGPTGGDVDALYCDSANNKVWVGGSFTSPSTGVVVWDAGASSWSSPPFTGLSGADARVLSITSNSSQLSLFFAGSFITSFVGNGTTNNTNNPNVPYSSGATPYSSSLVPYPLSGAQVLGSPSSSESGFSNISAILCPSGTDGAGYTWFAADDNTAVITIRQSSVMTARGLRLGNTFIDDRGTTEFSVTTLPDNTVQTLTYLDPDTSTNTTCSDPCPLSTDSSVLYQDFLFDSEVSITGVQITLSDWEGDGAGLHLLQILSAGAFVSAVASENGKSCYAPAASNTTYTGNWSAKVADTDVSGTTQTVLVSDVASGTSPADGPSFTWEPYVSASGEYDVYLIVPGCTNFQDCDERTSVTVTVFPGDNLDPWVTTVSQTNEDDVWRLVYSGPIYPTEPDFVTTVTMTLADNSTGSGTLELVAASVELILTYASTSNSSSSSNSTLTSSSVSSFGFLEWPISSDATYDAMNRLPNKTETNTDVIGFALFTGAGGNSSLTSSSKTEIATVAHHSSGSIFVGGNFTLSGDIASGASNVLEYNDGTVSRLADYGLNGVVTALVISADQLFVGGSFNDTASGSTSGKLRNIAVYDVESSSWSTVGSGVDGAVTSLGLTDDGQLIVAGNFTTLLSSADSDQGTAVPGLAVWNVNNSTWASGQGFVVGAMTLVANGTSSSSQFVAGSVDALEDLSASGFVMLTNGDNGPDFTSVNVQLSGDVSSSTTSSSSSKRSLNERPPWLPHFSLPSFFRRSSTSISALPATVNTTAPVVLAGAFWTNSSSSSQVVILGGNFSTSAGYLAVAIYDPDSEAVTGLQGNQINGTVYSLLVDGDKLYIGGEFTIEGTTANGFAIYNLASQAYEISGIQAPEAASGSSVIVRSITKTSAVANSIFIAGTFSQLGSLSCEAICLLDTSSNQWTALGGGIQGEIATVDYAGSSDGILVACGSIALSAGTSANVVQFTFSNNSWTAIGDGSDLPGPVTALAVNNGNESSIFAAGRSSDNSTAFLSYWNGVQWSSIGSSLNDSSSVAQLVMVPLQSDHNANSIVQSDRLLMISGSLSVGSYGNASSALFDGQTFTPYIVSSTSTGTSGTIAGLFNSLSTFSFSQHKYLATGIVILISIAISAGVVFLLALIGIIWTLFSRRDDRIDKLQDDDDDSVQHRPSSLLEHVNAATRTTILGNPFVRHSQDGDADEKMMMTAETPVSPTAQETDPFAPDESNYVRAETPSDAIHGTLLGGEASRPAHVRYSFDGHGEGELPLLAGDEVEVLDDRDAAWWYARDIRTGREGVVPAAYLY